MARGDPYGEDYDDGTGGYTGENRGPFPKNPGDRAYGHGDEVTLELTGSASAGDVVTLNGDGTVTPGGGDEDGVTMIGGDSGDHVTVHLQGVVRVNGGASSLPVVDTVDGDDIVLLG